MRTTLAPSPPLSSQAQPRPLGAGRQLPSLPCLVRGRCAASPGLHGSHAASHPRPTLTASRAASTLGIEAYAPVKPMADDLGVVIFSEHEQGLPELINLYQKITRRENVAAAHLAAAVPSLAQAVLGCVQRGASRVMVVPWSFSGPASGAIAANLPFAVAEVQLQMPSVKIATSDPIGLERVLVEMIESRVSVVDTRPLSVAERGWSPAAVEAPRSQRVANQSRRLEANNTSFARWAENGASAGTPAAQPAGQPSTPRAAPAAVEATPIQASAAAAAAGVAERDWAAQPAVMAQAAPVAATAAAAAAAAPVAEDRAPASAVAGEAAGSSPSEGSRRSKQGKKFKASFPAVVVAAATQMAFTLVNNTWSVLRSALPRDTRRPADVALWLGSAFILLFPFLK